MAQLPPSAVFGAVVSEQPVHVLLLIENSLPMMEHWQNLQRHILPGILGAVRIANPGVNVQIFWETTGKTHDQRLPQKSQRHFNDFPDIDIVGMPRNKLSPFFVRQSIDLFLLGNNAKLSVTRHLFIIAMSNPLEDLSGGMDSQHNRDDTKWDAVASKLQENEIFLHLIANPLARLTRVFELFRKTMRHQSRQEVIPWQPTDNTHCICHLSGSARAAQRARAFEEWPVVQIASPESPSANLPQNMSDEELPSTPISPIDMINWSSASPTLVSRMQALHGLANRRRHSDGRRRSSLSRTPFFADTPPAPSPRRERLLSARSSGRQREQLRQLSTESVPLLLPLRGVGPSALDLRGMVQDNGLRSPTHANGGSDYDPSIPSNPLASSYAMALVPSSPASDSSSSRSPLSPLTLSRRNTDESSTSEHSGGVSYAYTGSSADAPPSAEEIFGSASNGVSTRAVNDAPLPISTIAYQAPITTGRLTAASTYAAYADHPMALHPEINAHAPAAYQGYATSGPMGGAAAPATPLTSQPIASMSLGDSTGDLDEEEIEYVPASAPPDARGQVPFVFDHAYEAHSAQRLHNILVTMSGSQSVPGPEEKHTAYQQQSPIIPRPPPLLGTQYKPSPDMPVGHDVRYNEPYGGAYYAPSAEQYA